MKKASTKHKKGARKGKVWAVRRDEQLKVGREYPVVVVSLVRLLYAAHVRFTYASICQHKCCGICHMQKSLRLLGIA